MSVDSASKQIYRPWKFQSQQIIYQRARNLFDGRIKCKAIRAVNNAQICRNQAAGHDLNAGTYNLHPPVEWLIAPKWIIAQLGLHSGKGKRTSKHIKGIERARDDAAWMRCGGFRMCREHHIESSRRDDEMLSLGPTLIKLTKERQVVIIADWWGMKTRRVIPPHDFANKLGWRHRSRLIFNCFITNSRIQSARQLRTKL